jgi:hypothetical protein
LDRLNLGQIHIRGKHIEETVEVLHEVRISHASQLMGQVEVELGVVLDLIVVEHCLLEDLIILQLGEVLVGKPQDLFLVMFEGLLIEA